ncbi:MAG: carbohydrate-binding domain-containing protein [Clostridia bacterium]|nr:carbohydrate-binding domain-containing protein [Clostridia bacterium]
MKHRKMERNYYWKNNGKISWFRKHWKKAALIAALSVSLTGASIASGLAAGRGGQMNGGFGGGFGGFMGGGMAQNTNVTYAENPTEIVTSAVENAAASLTADLENAVRIQMSDSNNKVKIAESGTYVVSGDCEDGRITVQKEVTGVVLVLENLNLSSSKGAAVSINKDAQAQIVISGSVMLTDSENPQDENSADAETADAYDGAAIKAKAGSQVYLTGDGTLTINGNAKNGIKAGNEDASFFVDGGNLTLNITAVNDGINAGADLTLLSGAINVSAGDDAIHADRILTVGKRDAASGPSVTVSGTEGLEATVINIFSGDVQVSATDDAINATQKDDTLTASLNMTGGAVTVSSRTDGIDSNGNINLLGGVITIASSASFGGEAGIDYDGVYYVADGVTLNNPYGVAGPDGGGMRGGMDGQGFNQRGGWNRGTEGQDFQDRGGKGQFFQNGQPQMPDGSTSATQPSLPQPPDDNSMTDGNTSATQPNAMPNNGQPDGLPMHGGWNR